MKALVIGSGIISVFVVKKYSKLLDKTFSIFEEHKKDLKDSSREFKNDISSLERSIALLRGDILNDITIIKQDFTKLHDRLFELHNRYSNDFERYFVELGKVDKLEQKLKDSYGKIIFIEENLKATDNKVNIAQKELGVVALILAKHKEKISKLP
jgi:chromosome segregation ATPase